MESSPHDLEQLADTKRLTAWLDVNIPALGEGPLETALLHGGTSNVVLTIRRGGETMVLRRPPAVPAPRARNAACCARRAC